MKDYLESPTYLHIKNCILKHSNGSNRVKVLDAGCGSGGLVRYLLSEGFDVYGYDITGVGYDSSFYENIRKKVGTSIASRIKLIDYKDRIPYDDGYFDFVVSNQVVEHVDDFDHFFSETNRVLVRYGTIIHCFPVRNIIIEPHIFLPFVHRIPYYLVPYYIWLFKKRDWKFAIERKNYLYKKCFYRTIRFFKQKNGFEKVDLGQSSRLLASKYSFLNNKFILSLITPLFFSFISSVTVIYNRKK
jgi:SAM-dependent methyltransferase